MAPSMQVPLTLATRALRPVMWWWLSLRIGETETSPWTHGTCDHLASTVITSENGYDRHF